MGGRPKLPPEAKRSAKVEIMFTPSEYDGLASEAMRAYGPRVAIAGYLRELILAAKAAGVSLMTKPRGASR